MPASPERPSQDLKLQLLGVAFAGADLVFEVDRAGVVAFALGAAERTTGRALGDLVGANWADIVEDAEADLLDALQRDLGAGERTGPLRVAMRRRSPDEPPRAGSLSVLRLPQRTHRLSCALSLGAPMGCAVAEPDGEGFLDRDAFLSAVAGFAEEAERAGLPVRLDLIQLDGLQAASAALTEAEAERLRRTVAATLRSEAAAGLGASEVAADKFALLRPASASADSLNRRLQAVVGDKVAPVSAALPLAAAPASQSLKAMRYALDRYIEDGPDEAGASFAASVERTVRDTNRFKGVLASQAFHLAYQPVVALADESLHHFEALARFDPHSSPADTIRLAEELNLIIDFDLAVLKSVAAVLAADRSLKIAANVSAASLMQPRLIEALIALPGADAGLRPRLLLEITETTALSDLVAANAILKRLRSLGHVVCLDDFGAGAASLDYLRQLDVDVVKIDGRYVQALGADTRDAAIVKHVVALCRELGVLTIAEMIEGPEAARIAREFGVDLGQGWRFGKPTAQPKWAPEAPQPARRLGVVEQWG